MHRHAALLDKIGALDMDKIPARGRQIEQDVEDGVDQRELTTQVDEMVEYVALHGDKWLSEEAFGFLEDTQSRLEQGHAGFTPKQLRWLRSLWVKFCQL